ncbi:hypothetical protein GQ457_04G022790 [Hibiscus cannabinus]
MSSNTQTCSSIIKEDDHTLEPEWSDQVEEDVTQHVNGSGPCQFNGSNPICVGSVDSVWIQFKSGLDSRTGLQRPKTNGLLDRLPSGPFMLGRINSSHKASTLWLLGFLGSVATSTEISYDDGGGWRCKGNTKEAEGFPQQCSHTTTRNMVVVLATVGQNDGRSYVGWGVRKVSQERGKEKTERWRIHHLNADLLPLIKEDSFPVNHERAIVLFNPKPLLLDPNHAPPLSPFFSLRSDLVSGFKNQLLWATDMKSVKSEDSRKESEGYLAVVPWVPCQIPSVESIAFQ